MREGPLAHEKVVGVIKEAASALSQAHAEGFAHRDIKPENILLDRDGRVRVADFGLAASSEESAQLSQAGAPLGTPGYMAPEQRDQADAEKIDQRADIYSLGCLAHEMLCGKLPTDEARRTLSEFGVPKSAEAVILKAMEESPLKRFEPADAIVCALDLRMVVLGFTQQRRTWIYTIGVVL